MNLKKFNSKKFFTIFALIALTAFFSGCTQPQPEETAPETPTTFEYEKPPLFEYEFTPQQEKLSLGQSYSSDKVKVTVFSATRITQYSYLPENSNTPETVFPAEGNTFYLVTVSVKNLIEEEIFSGASYFSMLASGDYEGYRYNATLFHDTEKALSMLKEIPTKETISGKVLFEVPKNFTGWKLQYRFGLPVYWEVQ